MAHSHQNCDAHSGESHGSMKSYIFGFILSIILTLVPYYIVVNHVFDTPIVAISITVLAILQLLVQVIFFLHLNSESKPRWNLMAFNFTVLVVAILVAGSLWIMVNLNYHMMIH